MKYSACPVDIYSAKHTRSLLKFCLLSQTYSPRNPMGLAHRRSSFVVRRSSVRSPTRTATLRATRPRERDSRPARDDSSLSRRKKARSGFPGGLEGLRGLAAALDQAEALPLITLPVAALFRLYPHSIRRATMRG